MKPLIILLFLSLISFSSSSQILEPVKWKFSKVKINNTTYKIYMTASIDPGWHIYSQVQPKGGIASPLRVNFEKNSFFILEGRPVEIGKMSKVDDNILNVSANQYSGKLQLVQLVKLKKAPAALKGIVTFQVCNDKQCLSPQDEEFSIVLN